MRDYKKLMDDALKKEVEAGNLPGTSALVLYKGKEICPSTALKSALRLKP